MEEAVNLNITSKGQGNVSTYFITPNVFFKHFLHVTSFDPIIIPSNKKMVSK